MVSQRTLRLGLLLNPWAGIGGPAALKGSDGDAIRSEAIAQGVTSKVAERVSICLKQLHTAGIELDIVCAAADMGADVCSRVGFKPCVIGCAESHPSTAGDTQRLAGLIVKSGVDLLLFAGGDGTARDIYAAVGPHQPVLGLPAGVKMHSGVYATSPRAAAEIITALAKGHLVDVANAEVRDIDEEAYREGIVRAKYFGEMRVPMLGDLVQAVKYGGQAGSADELDDLVAYAEELFDDEDLLVLGPGSTLHAIGTHLGIESSLLGFDVIVAGQQIGNDLSESALYELLMAQKTVAGPVSLWLTAIGGQGHIIGRGNQQLSPRVLRLFDKRRVRIFATTSKLQNLQGRPFIIDSGDTDLDTAWSGVIDVVSGYREEGLYPVRGM